MADTLVAHRAERTVAPTFEPVTLDEAKLYLRIDAGNREFDALIESLLAAARDTFERDTDLILCTSTWRERFDDWPDEDGGDIVLAKRPVQSVSSLTYVDSNGSTQTWSSANYALDNGRGMPAIVLAYNVLIPSYRSQRNSIVVTYVGGFTVSTIPEACKQAIKSLVAAWFDEPAAVSRGTISETPLAYQRIVANWQRPNYP